MLFSLRKQSLSVLLLCLVFSLTACKHEQFLIQINEFQSGVNNTTVAIGAYYLELNQFERELYLQERLYDPLKEVLTAERDLADPSRPLPTALVGQTFSAESIKARMDTITLLGIYGKRLAELANIDSPTKFAAASQSIGTNLKDLGDTFSTLTNDPTASNYAASLGVLSTIFGIVGQSVLEFKRDAALSKAVEEAAPQVSTIIDLLENDLNTVIGPLRLTGAKQMLSTLIYNYNNNRTSMSFEQRKAALNEISSAQARYDLAIAFNPSGLMKSMKDAHEALVAYAKSGRKPQNLTELVNAVNVFKERAQTIVAAIIELRDLRRSTK